MIIFKRITHATLLFYVTNFMMYTCMHTLSFNTVTLTGVLSPAVLSEHASEDSHRLVFYQSERYINDLLQSGQPFRQCHRLSSPCNDRLLLTYTMYIHKTYVLTSINISFINLPCSIYNIYLHFYIIDKNIHIFY